MISSKVCQFCFNKIYSVFICFSNFSKLVPLIRESKLSALELYEECARRIKLTKTLNHFISDTSAFASLAAQAIDQRIKGCLIKLSYYSFNENDFSPQGYVRNLTSHLE